MTKEPGPKSRALCAKRKHYDAPLILRLPFWVASAGFFTHCSKDTGQFSCSEDISRG
jgi:hypothetical protein